MVPEIAKSIPIQFQYVSSPRRKKLRRNSIALGKRTYVAVGGGASPVQRDLRELPPSRDRVMSLLVDWWGSLLSPNAYRTLSVSLDGQGLAVSLYVRPTISDRVT